MDYPIVVKDQQYMKDKRAFLLRSSTCLNWTLFAPEAGRFQFRINSCTGEAGTGDLLVCPPHTVLHREMVDPLSSHYVKFDYARSSFQHESDMAEQLRDLFAYKITLTDQERLRSTLRSLHDVDHLHDLDSALWRTHLMNDLWLSIKQEAAGAAHSRSIGDPLMAEAQQWLQSHLHEELFIRDVAARFHLHPVHFARRFNRCFGVTPSQYLTGCRIENGQKLLRQTDYTIEHIAQLCGYDNGFYFSRMFTKTTRMSPSQYRKTHSPLIP
ncbi:AraC family transcriptional regulator [Paenibacillus sp. J5C_2022]|uniref:helix-turn-helix domain-containing protein n=1 Tax=Paenibacillus sp. J5C2022 TaxID=2977129 RepID=UPI0021D33474|nr:AraC family transcriptional regulator [Paenibacillus sp. J5C2022]MCU6712160.1 AraC family transcriptional regulator [Paenibacillus sp. J5C2022]